LKSELPYDISAWIEDREPKFEPLKTGRFQKILVRESGVTYEAWSADGKTPIFPIPL
jgi:hypothetical protein